MLPLTLSLILLLFSFISSISAPDTPSLNSSSSIIIATALLSGSFGVSAHFRFLLDPSSKIVNVDISVNGLQDLNSSAQYAYHLHTNPISSNGNCSTALGHLDPLQVTDAIVCNPLVPQYCEVGDLSGRNGKLLGNQSVYNLSYSDPYLRFWPQPFSLLGRSIVIHLPNSTRIACGNITSTIDGTADSQGQPTNQSSNYVTQYSSRAPPPSPAKLEPFSGTATLTAVLATMTLPASLPDVRAVPNVFLTVQPSLQTIKAQLMTATLPAAVPAATNFDYTPGAQLPTQQDINILNQTNSSINNTQPINTTLPISKPSSGVGAPKLSAVLVVAAMMFNNLI